MGLKGASNDEGRMKCGMEVHGADPWSVHVLHSVNLYAHYSIHGMAKHGEHMEAQTPMGLQGASDDRGMRSYQVPNKVEGDTGHSCEWRHEGCVWLHGGAWGRFINIHGTCMHFLQ